MFNSAQIHLALNHLPVEGTLFGLLVLLFGLATKKDAVRRTGLGILVLSALVAIPALRSGEPAEDMVKQLPGFTRELIHEHEEAAEVAFVVTLIAGIAAAGTLALRKFKKEALEIKASIAVALVSLVAFGLMARASHLGGLVRHSELREGVATSGEPVQNPGAPSGHDADNH